MIEVLSHNKQCHLEGGVQNVFLAIALSVYWKKLCHLSIELQHKALFVTLILLLQDVIPVYRP